MAFKVKRYSTSFKLVLMMLTFIGVGYALKVFTTGTKQTMLADTDTIAVTPPIKHKVKHRVKRQVGHSVAAILGDTSHTVKISKTSDPVMTPSTTAPIEPATLIKPSPPTRVTDGTTTANKYLYTTYVQPNVTGIVKLRATDKFNSDVLADIPARSAVQVLARGVTYYRVVYNNAIGFVPKWALNIR